MYNDTQLMVWQVYARILWDDGQVMEGPVSNVLFYRSHAESFCEGMNSVDRVGTLYVPLRSVVYYALERPARWYEVRELLAMMEVIYAKGE